MIININIYNTYKVHRIKSAHSKCWLNKIHMSLKSRMVITILPYLNNGIYDALKNNEADIS